MVNPRSWLFCPGDRPDRLSKAAAVADVVVADLEDAVPVEGKSAARTAVVRWLRANPSLAVRAWVRVNNDDQHLGADLDALDEFALAGLVLPKAEPESAAAVAGRSQHPLLALVETATGLWRLGEIAGVEGVRTLALGEYDLAAELGAAAPDVDAAPLAWARGQVVAAAAAAGLAPPPAPVCAAVADQDGFRESTSALLRAGFFGRMCIHPRQVEVVHAAMRPTDGKVDEAREVIRAADAAAAEGTGVVVVDGRMVDAPILRRAHRVLALAAADDTR